MPDPIINFDIGGIANVSKALKDISTSLDRLNKSVDQLGEKMATFGNKSKAASDRTKQGTKEQRQQMAALKREIREVEGNFVGSAKKRAKALDVLKKKQDALTASMQKTGKVAQTGANNAAKAQANLNKQVSLGRQLFLRLKSVMLTVFGAYAVIQGIRNTINIIKEFELGVKRVQAITGATSEEIKRLADSARVLGGEGIFNPAEITELQVILAKLGFTIKEISESTEGIVNLATATGEGLAPAAELVASIIRGLGLAASETSRVVDVLGKSFTSSALDLAKFKESAKFLVPLAREMGWSIEQLGSVLGTLADNIISGSLAGTGMRTLLIELADPTSKLTALMGENVRTFEDFIGGMERMQEEGVTTAQVLEAVPKRAVTLFTALKNGTADVRELYETLKDANGAIKEMADVQMDTLALQTERASNAWAGFILSMQNTGGLLANLFEGAADTLNGLARAIDPMAFALSDAADSAKAFIDVISKRGAAGKVEILSERVAVLGDESAELKTKMLELNEAIEDVNNGVGSRWNMAKYEELRKELEELEVLYVNVNEQIRIFNEEILDNKVADLYEGETARINRAIDGLVDAGFTAAEATLEVYQDALMKWQSFQDNFTSSDPLDFFVFEEVEKKLQEDLNELFKTFAKEEEEELEESLKRWKKYIKDRRDLINAEKELAIERSENVEQSELQHALDMLKIKRDYRRKSLELDIESGNFSSDVMAIKHQQLLELEETYQRERQEIIDKWQEDSDNALFKSQQARLKIAKRIAEEELEIQGIVFKTRLQEMENAGASEQQIQRETLKYQIQVLKTQIRIAKAFNVSTMEIRKMEAEIELLNAQILGITDDEAVEEVEEGAKKISDVYRKLAQEVIDSLQTIVDAQVDNTSRLVDDLDTRIAETQRALDQEIALYTDGYANNVTAKRQELAELKQARDQAIRDREVAIRRQQQLEAISQAANLFSAVAKTINTYSAIPGVGYGIAAGVVAAFLALFKTAQTSIKNITQFADGGEVNGNSHARGGVVLEAEGGEFIINKRAYSKYHGLVNAINEDNLPTLDASVLNNTTFEKRGGDVVLENAIWNKMYDLWDKNLNGEKVEVQGNKKIITKGIRKRIIRNV